MYKNKIIAMSMFSNVGIAETYMKELGIDVVLANELVEERARFYRHLYPETEMVCGDITEEEIFDGLEKRARELGVNMIIATPPCQGMSCAGKKDPADPRNRLIYYAVEMIKRVRPDLVILENVPMQMHTNIKYQGRDVLIPDYIDEELSGIYRFNDKKIVNTKDYGIPQSRQRYIYLMANRELDIKWEFPDREEKEITLKQAIGHLPALDPQVREREEQWRFPDYEEKRRAGLLVSRWHCPPLHSWKQIEWMLHTPSGKSAFGNSIYYPCKNNRRIKGALRTYMRMDWNKPATTVLQNSGVISTFSTVHPGRLLTESEEEENRLYSDARVLTIYELLIVSSLPLDWDIPDWAGDILIRKVIGEGIPPLLIKKALENL